MLRRKSAVERYFKLQLSFRHDHHRLLLLPLRRAAEPPRAAAAAPAASPPAANASVKAGSLSCAAPQQSAGSVTSGSASLGISVSGNDLTQTFTSGSTFTVKFAAVTQNADVIGWQIVDYTGTALASGSINVPKGSTTATVACSSTLAGYFAASAKLQNSGATQPQLGSRPAGYASFGVLPNVADLVPGASGALDAHRIGLQGANYVESGVCCSGTGLQPVNENLGSTWVSGSALSVDDRAEQRRPIQPGNLCDRPGPHTGHAGANRHHERSAGLGKHGALRERRRIVSSQILQRLPELLGASGRGERAHSLPSTSRISRRTITR